MVEVNYEGAATALEAAAARASNVRPTLLRILELQGIVSGILDRPEKSRTYFRTLLLLEPTYVLPDEYPPRVTMRFAEARTWASARPSLKFVRGEPFLANGAVESVVVKVPTDPLTLAEKVRFHVKTEAGQWRTSEVPLREGQAEGVAGAATVEWWAELLGSRSAVLQVLGDPTHPLVDRTEGGPPYRTLSYIAFGGAVASAAVGTFFGIRVNQAQARFRSHLDPDDPHVVLTSDQYTQKMAQDEDARAKSDAALANALFITAGALAVTGGVFYYLGSQVTVTPTVGGVAVAGAFP